jgi:hypothetical protein
MPADFGAIFVLFIVLAIGMTVVKVSMARSMARRSGLSEGEATAITLLDEEGLSATYLASNLRPQAPAAPSVVPGAPRLVADRLDELKGLLEAGHITQAEHDARRQAILDSI